jgi:type IV pilus assembly protein PilM
MLNFLKPKIQAFGIDLSDFSVKIIAFEKKVGKISLASFGRQEIIPGIIEEGEIKKELIEVIKRTTKEAQGLPLKNKYCIVSLPEAESFIRVLQLPMMEKVEVGEAIKWEIETNIPLGLNEIYYDWQIINPPVGKPETMNQQHLDVLVGVLPKRIVNPYLSVLKLAGLQPLAFEIESLAISRALLKNGTCEEPTMVIDMGARKTSLVIFYGQAVYLTASLPISNSSLIAALSEQLHLDMEQAKQIKFQQGLNCEDPQNQVFQTLKPSLDELIEKIKSYIDFFQSHAIANLGKKDIKINRILLCGGGARFTGLDKFLQQTLQINVTIGKPWLNIFPSEKPNLPAFDEAESLAYTTAIGLALRGITEEQ